MHTGIRTVRLAGGVCRRIARCNMGPDTLPHSVCLLRLLKQWCVPCGPCITSCFLCRLVDSLGPFAGMQHLDVAGGTGDVAFRVLRAIQAAEQQQQPATTATAAHTQPQPQQPQQQSQMPQPPPVSQQQQQLGHVTVFDINAEMLKVGQQRAQEQGECVSSWHGNGSQACSWVVACRRQQTKHNGNANTAQANTPV